jgi:hypothetical protein
MHRFVIAVSMFAAAASAQSFLELPASTAPAFESPNYNLRPFMQTNCRLQMFFDATEAGSSAFTAEALALRYDGPIPQVGAPGPFQIQRLQILVGSTAVALPAADFAQNLTQPLVSVFDGPWSYLPDPGSASPHPWGAPSGSLRFPFTNPAPIAIPAGGWFVVEIRMQGNNIANFGFSHAILDGYTGSGGVADGTAVNFGQGCSAAPLAPPATISSTGTYAPGAAHFVSGQNLGANTLVIGVLGGSDTNSTFGQLPFQLPTTTCELLTSIDLDWLMLSDAGGAIQPDQQSAAIAVPPNPAFAGVTIYEQLISIVPGANAFDLVLSDARAITLGSVQAPPIGVYTVSHGADANAAIADRVEPFGYAVQLQVH